MSETTPSLGGCVSYGNASVLMAPRGIVRRRVFKCWTCERRTPFVQRWDGAWYGVTDYCTVCLDGWQDEYRLERPFRRGWKKERGAYIKELWDGAMLPDRYDAWTRYDVHRAVCEEDPCVECETRPS